MKGLVDPIKGCVCDLSEGFEFMVFDFHEVGAFSGYHITIPYAKNGLQP